MKNKPTFSDFKEVVFKDQEFLAEYEKLKPEFAFVKQLIMARKKSKISQADLAEMLHTKQPAVARFENGGFSRSSISTIADYADALGYVVKIRLVPKHIHKNT